MLFLKHIKGNQHQNVHYRRNRRQRRRPPQVRQNRTANRRRLLDALHTKHQDTPRHHHNIGHRQVSNRQVHNPLSTRPGQQGHHHHLHRLRNACLTIVTVELFDLKKYV